MSSEEENINVEQADAQIAMKKRGGKLRRAFKWVAIAVVFLCLLPTLLYIPAIQNAVVGFVSEKVSESTGYSVTIGRFLLKFPFRVSVSDVLVLDEQSDTLMSGESMELSVRLLPLIKGEVAVDGVAARNAFYKMTSSDSSMVLTARLRKFDLQQSKVGLLSEHIDLSSAVIDGADVEVVMDATRVRDDEEESEPATWLVTLGDLQLSDVRYRMSMMPAIDSLDVRLAKGGLQGVSVNMAVNLIRAKTVEAERLSAVYLMPDSVAAAEFAAAVPVVADEKTEKAQAKPWTIRVERFRVRGSDAQYAVRGTPSTDEFNPENIRIGGIDIRIDDFYNHGGILQVPISKIAMREHSGLEIKDASGLLEMTDSLLSVRRLQLETQESSIAIDAVADASILSNAPDASLQLSVESDVAMSDVGYFVPGFKSAWGAFEGMSASLAVDMSGTLQELEVKEVSAKVANMISVKAKGTFFDLNDEEKAGGKLIVDGRLFGGRSIRSLLGLGKDVNVPLVRLKGMAEYKQKSLAGDLTAYVDSGKIVADGRWNMSRDSYRGKVRFDGLDGRSVLPEGQFGRIVGDLEFEGAGFDPYRMSADAAMSLESIEFDSVEYRNINLSATLRKGDYDVRLASDNEFADLDLSLRGKITKTIYQMAIAGHVENLDLTEMNLSADRLSGGMDVKGFVFADVGKNDYGGVLRLSDLFVLLPANTFRTDSIDLGFRSDSTRTNFRLRNNDFTMRFHSTASMFALSDSVSRILPELDTMMTKQYVDVAKIQAKLPQFDADVQSGNRNIVHAYLEGSGVSYDRFDLTLRNADEFDAAGQLDRLTIGEVLFDTLTLDMAARDKLRYRIGVNNSAKNQEFMKEAYIEGNIGGNSMDAFLLQKDQFDEVGFEFGVKAELSDSIVSVGLFPEKPRIAFLDWKLNEGNYVAYNLSDGKIKADMSIENAERGYINIYTARDNQFHNGANVELSGIELRDWLVMSPFSPPIEGALSAKVSVNYNEKLYWGTGEVLIDDMRYGKRPVGDLRLDTRLALTGERGNVYALAGMDIDGHRFLSMRGYRLDSVPEPQYDLHLEIDSLPLSTVSAFMPESAGTLTGALNGKIAVSGNLSAPKLDGYLQFDSARIKMPMFGTSLAFDDEKIPVEDGVVRFNAYDVVGANGNPLTFDGFVRLFPMEEMYTDLKIKGRNVQIVDGKKTGKSELYGKGFIDANASIVGSADMLDMKATLSVLAGTNLIYVYQSGAVALSEAGDDDMLRFVNFSDTTTIVADTLAVRPFGMKVKAALIVQPNALFTVNLSPDGKNCVQIDGDGMLSYSQNDQGDMSLIGRYTLRNGFVRYSPPMMSEKLFKFQDGGSLTWTGNLLNPSIDVTAIQSMKVNIGGGNQGSRTVPFDVMLKVGNTLSSLDVSFDLASEGDMTIANELAGMSAEQRSTQAMNLLLYNTYTGPSASAGAAGLLSENMAFSFLESVVNNWAANNISGIDLSFGIDQYDKVVDGATSTTTSYSYQVSKSVFDDRFKIVVGGNYVSDASAEDNLSQNLLNDLSFEYKLNKTGTMYVKLFHHKEYESILEGEITETGAGFVWKRKIASWRDMFRFLKPRRDSMQREGKTGQQ